MDKKFKLLDDSVALPSSSSSSINWEKCILCQEVKNESLTCPANSKRKRSDTDGYTTLAKLLEGFNDIGHLPKFLANTGYTRSDDIENSFRDKKAKWHDSCRLRFNKTKLSRANTKLEPDVDMESF